MLKFLTFLCLLFSFQNPVHSEIPREIKVLILIPSSDGLPVYKELEKIWRAYMKSDPSHVEAYFVKADPSLDSTCQLIGDTLWSKTEENFFPGMTMKTLLAMEYMHPRLHEFDYIIRTNLSSFYVYPRLLDFLKTLPIKGCYAGHIDSGSHEKCCASWGCGAGLYFSPDVVDLMVKNKEEILKDPFLMNTFDDVFIAYFLKNKQVGLISAPRMEWYGTREQWHKTQPIISDKEFHIKVKNLNPSLRLENDPYILSQLIKIFYPKSYEEFIQKDENLYKYSEDPVNALSQKVAKEPNNLTAMFELAQAYDNKQTYPWAIKWFKNRIEKGENKDEVWGSMYKLGEIHNCTGDWKEAFEWYQKAYQASPDRAEPLWRIAQHYRFQGQNNLSYLYAKRAAEIPRPEKTSIFFDPFVYDHGIDEELSIIAFYTPHREEGRKASDRIILKRGVPPELKDQTYRNMIHYAPILSNAKIIPIKIDLPLISDGNGATYMPMNPSIQKTPHGYRVLCRTVNYIRNGYADFKIVEPNSPSKSRNFVIDYDADFNVRAQKEIVESFPRKWTSHWEGLEDARLIAENDYPDKFTCASIGTHAQNIGQSLCKFKYDSSDTTVIVEQLIPLKGPDERRCEKNWLPFIKDQQLLMIYGYDPFTIFKINQATGDSETVVSYQPPLDFSRFRGSASPIAFNQGYLFVEHEVIQEGNSIFYMHRFVQLDNNLKITHISKPFFFKKKGLEYCCGMTLDHSGKNLILSIGIDDREAYLITLDAAEAKSMLESIDIDLAK